MTDRRGKRADHQDREAFGQHVRSIRQAKGLSQEELADRAGVHRTYVSSLERGQRNVGLDNIHAIARALGVDPAKLFAEDTDG